jgi:hypothetical protein
VTAPGTYKVQVKTDDCVSDFSDEKSFIITGISKEVSRVDVYPNPATFTVSVKGLTGATLSARVYDLTGKSTELILTRTGEVHFGDVQHLPPGLYLLTVPQGATTQHLKFLKK